MKNKSLIALIAIPLAGLGVIGTAFASTHTLSIVPNQQQSVQADTKDTLVTPDALVDPSLAKISADTAKATAVTAHPGQVREIKLETDDGPLVYSVMILNGIKQYEVRVDAVSGKVLSNKLDEANYHNDENE